MPCKPLSLFPIAVVLIAGCSGQPNSTDLVSNDAPSSFLSSSVPAEITTIEDATASLEKGEGNQVTIIGRIYGGDRNAFDPSSATFSIVDMPGPGHAHDDPGDCPFCKRKLDAAAMAVVMLKDDQGEVLSKSADKILGIKRNQDVVVEGVGSLLDGLLIVSATSVHIPESPYDLSPVYGPQSQVEEEEESPTSTPDMPPADGAQGAI